MTIVSTMILRSMRMIGEKPRGGSLDTSEQTETLAEFNTFLDSLPLERLYAYCIQQDSVALSASTSSLTVGPGGTLNTNRPVRLVDPCFVRDANGFDTPLEIINVETYGRIVDKDAGFTVPDRIFYDASFSATSTGRLFLYPSPSANLTLFINSWAQIGQVSSQSVNLSLPPGYQLFLESNFAEHLAAGSITLPPETHDLAKRSRAMIKSNNAPAPVMSVMDLPSASRHGNIFTGE